MAESSRRAEVPATSGSIGHEECQVLRKAEWLPSVLVGNQSLSNNSTSVMWRLSKNRQLRTGNSVIVASWTQEMDEKWALSVTGGVADTCPLVFEVVRDAPSPAAFRVVLTLVSNFEERCVTIDAKWNFKPGSSWSTGSAFRMGEITSSSYAFLKDGVLHGELMILPDYEQHQLSKTLPAAFSSLPMKSYGFSSSCIMSRAKVISSCPRIIVFDSFLSKTECEHLINLAAPHMRRSLVSGRTVSENRTSWSMFCTNGLDSDPVIQCVERRCIFYMKLLGLHVVPDKEKLQIMRYKAGEEFKAHFDNDLGDCSKRAATILMYLSDVESGGETCFPKGTPMHKGSVHDGVSLFGPGISVAPKKGRAMVFFSRRPDGSEDPCSLHAGARVRTGVKWIASKWVSIV